MSTKNTSARCARSGSIRACCRTKPGTPDTTTVSSLRTQGPIIPIANRDRDGRSLALIERYDFTRDGTAYGSLLSQGRRCVLYVYFVVLLGRLLRDGRRGAGHRGAAHVARLRLVVAADAVHGLAVVPHPAVVHRPFVHVHQFPLRGGLGERAPRQTRPRPPH